MTQFDMTWKSKQCHKMVSINIFPWYCKFFLLNKKPLSLDRLVELVVFSYLVKGLVAILLVLATMDWINLETGFTSLAGIRCDNRCIWLSENLPDISIEKSTYLLWNCIFVEFLPCTVAGPDSVLRKDAGWNTLNRRTAWTPFHSWCREPTKLFLTNSRFQFF